MFQNKEKKEQKFSMFDNKEKEEQKFSMYGFKRLEIELDPNLQYQLSERQMGIARLT